MDAWLNFAVMVGFELVIFALVARLTNASLRVSANTLFRCVLAGVAFGIVFDLVFGRFLGIFTYVLGFGVPFLIINGAISYGLMLATVSRFRKLPRLQAYLASAALGIAYETVNAFHHVWVWTFIPNTIAQEAFTIVVGYPFLVLLMAAYLVFIFRVRFRASSARR